MDAIGGAFEHQKGLLSVTPSEPRKDSIAPFDPSRNGIILTLCSKEHGHRRSNTFSTKDHENLTGKEKGKHEA